MVGWSRTLGTNMNILFSVVMLIAVALISVVPIAGKATLWNMTLLSLILAPLVGVYLLVRWSDVEGRWKMVFRVTTFQVEEMGMIVEEAFTAANIAFEGPEIRPYSLKLKEPFEWMFDVPSERLKVGVVTGPYGRALVGIGPVTEYNANEVERLKSPIDEALRSENLMVQGA
jgi:hypothetical protein